MERNDWNNRQGYANDRNQRLARTPREEENTYRGAYRFDTTSDHRNQSTWDGFGRRNDRDDSRDWTDYNRNYNNDYNRDYNRNYNSDQRTDRGRYNREEEHPRHSGGRHDSVHDRIEDHDPYGAGNFNADYRPDHFGNGGGANYGNMAGSLSYGYDGSYNSNPDWDSRFEPLSGHRRSYHGNYESRHPHDERYSRRQQHDSNDWY